MIYYCAKCYKWFKSGNTSCCVMHGANECCHYGDVEVIIEEKR